MTFPTISNPTGIAYDGTSDVYLATSYNSVPSLLKISSTRIVANISLGVGTVPRGCVYVNSGGVNGIFVCDTSVDRILFVDNTLTTVTVFTTAISANPKCITTDNTNLYVGLQNGTVLQILISNPATSNVILSTGLLTVTGISFCKASGSGYNTLAVSDASDNKIGVIDLDSSNTLTILAGISNVKDVINTSININSGNITGDIYYTTNTQVKLLQDDGNSTNTFTSTTVATTTYNPSSLSFMTYVNGNKFYITDTYDAIREYAPSLLISYYANPILTLPTGIAVDYTTNTTAYVAALNNGVQSVFEFDLNGDLQATYNLSTYVITGITTTNDTLYVCDSTGKQIMSKSGSGDYSLYVSVTTYGTPKCITNDGTYLYIGFTNGNIIKIDITTITITQLTTTGIQSVTGISYNNDILLIADPSSTGYVYAIDLSLTDAPILVHSNVGPIKDIIGFNVAISYTPTVITGSAIYCRENTMVKTSLSVKSLRYFTYNILEGLGYIADGATDVGPFYFTDTGGNTVYKIPTIANGTTTPYTIYNFITGTIGNGGGSVPCFLEGSTILCHIDGNDVYIPIEQVMPGTLVKTLRSGYKKVIYLGKRPFKNNRTNITDRLEQRLYKLSTTAYPELTEDLYLTGGHSILVESLTAEQENKTIEHLSELFITEDMYRLLACIDERAEVWDSEEEHTVWHFALEHELTYANYGVYANGGLVVESSSINYMKNKSNMILNS